MMKKTIMRARGWGRLGLVLLLLLLLLLLLQGLLLRLLLLLLLQAWLVARLIGRSLLVLRRLKEVDYWGVVRGAVR